MSELNKINGMQLFLLWKNLSFGLLVYIILVACTKLLPFYMAPVLTLGGALVFYRILYRQKFQSDRHVGLPCNVIAFAFFYSVVSYCVASITVNVLYAWGLIVIPAELIFFNYPYLVSLSLLPVSFITVLVMVLRGRSLTVCRDCRKRYGEKLEMGYSGILFERESRTQLYNLLLIFGLLSAIVWCYYIFVYSNVNINDRDNYIYVWMILLVFMLDEVYFVYRYINIYNELAKENEIISDSDLEDVSARTYVRTYVMCDDGMYVDLHAIDLAIRGHEVMDTPYQTKRNCNGLSPDEIKDMVESSFGMSGGELKFFFGRKIASGGDRTLLRYFYFLDGKTEDQPTFKIPGKWVKFSEIKEQYNRNPNTMAIHFVSDLTRLSTIIVTNKIYDEEGRRRIGLKSYRPSFTLAEVRTSKLDFQDDMWVDISRFNADVPHYHIKKWWRQIRGKQLPVRRETSEHRS